ncbi:MAG TPA: arsenate reductase ArsC [Gammaproteobacteria bacterium]|nr:arsenate reductase ArsC [Gammaproteobacteria bacterium]
MSAKTYNVLFLCTGNSARSIMGEAILNSLGRGKFRAFSAGSHPTGRINPFALNLLERRNHDVSELRSKDWLEFADDDSAPVMDIVITVCDKAAGEVCPVWPGQPVVAHWGLPDPAIVAGSEAEKKLAFANAYRELATRIEILAALPIEQLDRLTLQGRVREMGQKTRQSA